MALWSTSGNAASPSLCVATIGRRRLLFTLSSYLLFVRFALIRPISTYAQSRPVSILPGKGTPVGFGAPRFGCAGRVFGIVIMHARVSGSGKVLHGDP